MIVQAELLPRLNRSAAEEEDVASDSTHREVRRATMIDEFRAAPTHGAVNFPVSAETEEIDRLWFSRRPRTSLTLQGHPSRDSLACVFNHFPPGGNGFVCEYPETMN